MRLERTVGDLAGLLHLIHLESELMMTVADLRVFGSLHEGNSMTIIAYWAGYEFTINGLEPQGLKRQNRFWKLSWRNPSPASCNTRRLWRPSQPFSPTH
ncbi:MULTISPECIES: hypothetical protein [Enterobacteriaceae]|uniref:hypothetical protein n=1 Tax=Enterobacteriaceae TaxID=543 RepID=UPI001882A2E0|nr:MULTISPECIES: hypothetical protein [Enterobacteriaceae]